MTLLELLKNTADENRISPEANLNMEEVLTSVNDTCKEKVIIWGQLLARSTEDASRIAVT